VTAQAWWERATRDSASVKRNLAVLGGVTLAAILCIWSLGGVLAIIVGSVHVWSMADVGAGVASVLAELGIRRHRKRRDR
jgi:heme A synthase